QIVVRQVTAAGDVPCPQAGTRLGHFALEPLRGAGIDYLLGLLSEIGNHLLDASHALRIEASLETGGLRRHLAALDGPPFRAPLLQATVAHENLVVPVSAEHPPGAGACDPAAGIIDHHAVGVSDAKPADMAAELFGARKHVRQ